MHYLKVSNVVYKLKILQLENNYVVVGNYMRLRLGLNERA